MAGTQCRLTRILTLLCLLAAIPPAWAADQKRNLFGPEKFIRTPGAPNVYERAFNVPSYVGSPFSLEITNGAPDGGHGSIPDAVSSATVSLDGQEIVRRNEFSSTTATIRKEITLSSGTHRLEIQLNSAPDSYFRLTISGTIHLADLGAARSGHSATSQNDGTVLFAGGTGSAGASAESFDPATLKTSPLQATLRAGRFDHSANSLPRGETLIIGGSDSNGPLPSSELFRSSSKTFVPIPGSPRITRTGHSATLLADGSVLILGGAGATGASLKESESFNPNQDPLTGALYDPSTGVFTLLPNALLVPRANHTATLLANGQVLLTGGRNADGVLASAELFDPATGRSTLLSASMNSARAEHSATLRPDGSVLIAGGAGASGLLDSIEIYASQTFSDSPTKLIMPRRNHTATLLPIGEILIAGGEGTNGTLAHTELLGPPAADTAAPQIGATIPVNGANGVDLNAIVGVRFSEPIDVSTINVRLNAAGAAVAGVMGSGESGLYAFFVPGQLLRAGTLHTVELQGIRDLAGNSLANVSFSFTTVAAPAISSFAPTHGTRGTQIRILGSGFDPSGPQRNIVTVGTNNAVVSAVDETTLTISIPPSAAIGAQKITVKTRGGTVTSADDFTVDNPVPTLTSISPTQANANSPAITLNASGRDFAPSAIAYIGANALATIVTNANSLTAQIPANLLTTAGTLPVRVFNPLPGGGFSVSIIFTVIANKASIGNFVWNDRNANGIQEPGEPGIGGVSVSLLSAGGAVLRTTSTDANGTYRFGDLDPGSYAVRVIPPAGFSFSPPDAGDDDARDSDYDTNFDRTTFVAVIAGDDVTSLDAGLFIPAAHVAETSPRDGEADVAVTRETIIRLSQPLAAIPDPSPSNVYAEFGGIRLSTRIHVAPDRRAITLFYNQDLPASARVRVTLIGDALRDVNGNAIDADGDGHPGGMAHIDFDTLTLTTLTGTRACGRVFASELGSGSVSINVPLPGVTITVDGMETTLRTVTDAQGNFCLDPAPVGEFFVHIDGRTATIPIPPGDYYPSVGKKWQSIAGQSVNIGEIYLPRVIAGTLQPVSRVTDTVIGFPPAVLARFPNFAGVKITVPADSLYSDNGSRGGMVGIAPVPSDRLPSPLPPGISFPIVITVQTDGASNFDRPVPACFPNIANPLTGAPPLPANSTSALWSFNHDTGQFEIVGPMTVSADGQLVCTDSGIGILAPGWHGTLPGTNVSCHPPDLKKEKDCDEIQNDLNQNYQNKKTAGSASRGFAHQLACIASRGCHDPVTDKPDDPNRKIRNVFTADAEDAPNNPVDKICDKIKPWIPSQPGDEHIISRNDVCTAMAGMLYHFPVTLTMSFARNCPIPVPEHNKLIDEAIVPCFDELAASGDISTISAQVAKTLVPLMARGARDRANRACTPRSKSERGIASLAAATRMFTRDDLFVPSLDNVGLKVRAPNDDYFLRVGTKVQLRVTRSSGQDVTPSSTGTLYFVVTPDDIATITPEGELSILAAPVPWPDYTQPFYVVVRNGNDFGVGQFAIEDVDTDGDGVVDSVERRCGSDPNSNDPSIDSDDDTIPDVVEASMMLNAKSRDTDGDGIQDNVELENGMNPLVPSEDALDELRDPTYYSVTNPRTGFTVRGTTSNGLLTNLTLAQLETYYASFFDVRNGKVGFVRFTTPQNGLSLMMPRVVLRDPFPLDTDSDGLPDEVEAIIGTRPDLADSDHDGVSDKSEIDQGTNPLDGAPSRTGIVQSVKTPGTAVDVCAVNDMAVVAASTAGVAVFNVFNGMNPTIMAQVDTPGNAQAVACAGNRIAVADSFAGLAIIDITDPPAARIAYQLQLGNAVAVTASAGIAYVGLDSGQIVSVDLSSGSILEEIRGLSPVHDLAIERDTLLVLTSSDLRAFDLSSGSMQPRGNVATTLSPEGITRRRRLFVGGGYAYAASYPGYEVFDVRNPAALVQRGAAVFGGPRSFKQIVANGSGIGVAAVGLIPGDDGTHDIWLYDVSDPSLTNRLLTVLPTPGIARALSIYNGLAYVADSSAGLQVVNYLPSDARGIAPTIQLETNFAAGLAEEGHPMRLTANVSDDVQVRNVQFYVDGVKMMTDGNFPFEYRFITPLISQKASFTIRACATDTGGNSTCTAETPVTLTQDATPPRVTAVTPVDGAGVGEGTLSAISATFSEPIAATSLTTATFLLFASGPDGLIGTADDRLVAGSRLSYRDDVNKAFLTFPAVLPIDLYRAVIRSSVSDQKGNPLGADFVWTFRVKGPNSWINPNGGLWIDPNNWSDKRVPAATDNIFINQPGNYTVVVDHVAQVQQLTIGGVNSTPTVWIKGSSAGGHITLTVTGNLINSGKIRLESADSTYASQLVVQNGALTNFGAIEVNEGSGGGRTITANLSNSGTINVNYGTSFDGTVTNSGIINLAAAKKLSSVGNGNIFNQAGGTINGPGALEMNGGAFNFTAGPIVGLSPLLINVALNFGGSSDPAAFIQTGGSSTVRGTIAAAQTLWISGRFAGSHTTVIAPNGLTNAGTVRLESADSTYQSQLTISNGALTNSGTVQINLGSGGSRTIAGTCINQGTFNVDTTLDFTGTLTNTGTVNIGSGQKLRLGSGQTFNQNAGTIAGVGTLELTSCTLNFNGGTTTGTAPLLINSTLNFGNSTAAATFIQTGGSSTATGTIATAQTLWVSGRFAGSHTTLTVTNGLTNNGTIRLESIDSTYQSQVTITGGALTNNGTIDVNQGAGGTRTINGAFVNQGTLNINYTMDFVNILTNSGTINIAAGQKLRLTSGQTINHNGGTIAGTGLLELTNSTLNFNGGTTTGTTPLLINSTLNFGTSTVAASFIQTGGSSKASGTIAPAQTLWISGRGVGSHTTVTAPNGLTNAGTIRLESADSTYQSQLTITTGALTNNGTIQVNPGSGGSRVINGTFLNQGTVNVDLTMDFIGTLTNTGTINIASGQKLRASSGQTFNQNSGTIAGSGTLDLTSSTFNFNGGTIAGTASSELTNCTFNFNGGTTTGTTPLLINSTLNFGTSTVAASFIQTGASSKVSGTIAPQQTLWISGRSAGSHTIVTAPNGLTNAGTIRLESADSTYQSQLTITTGALTNSGTIQVNLGSGGSRAINGTFINQGTVNVDLTMDFIGTLTNIGTINIASGQKLRASSGQTFIQSGGTIAGAGGLELTSCGFHFNGGTISGTGTSTVTSSTFNFNGGTVSGAAPLLINSTLNFGTSTGAAMFVMSGASSQATGTIAAAQTLWVSGRAAGSHTTLNVASGLTNAGTLRLESADSTYQSQVTITGGTLTNTGTIEVNQGSGGTRTINGAFVNQGTLNVNYLTDIVNIMTNSGTINIASGQKLRFASGQTLNHNGGTIAGTGLLEITSSTLNFNGGTVTGTTPQLINGTLNFGNGPTGTAIFNITGGSGKISGNINAGTTLWVNGRGAGGHTTLTAAVGFTNAGTIRIESSESTYASNLTLTTGTLTNNGTIDIATGSGGTRAITAVVVNNGLMHINTPLTMTGTSFDNGAAGVIDGNGVVTLGTTTFRNGGQLNPGSSPAVFSITGALNQLAPGVVNIEIGGLTAGTQYDQLKVSAAANLDGTMNIRLINSYVPNLGDTFDVLTYGSRIGSFTTITGLSIGNGKKFNPTYGTNKLTLTVVPE